MGLAPRLGLVPALVLIGIDPLPGSGLRSCALRASPCEWCYHQALALAASGPDVNAVLRGAERPWNGSSPSQGSTMEVLSYLRRVCGF